MAAPSKKRKLGVTQEQINQFYDLLAQTKMEHEGGDLPWAEAPKEICEHYNRMNMKGFTDAGYFVMNGVKVCEHGTLDTVMERDNQTMEERMFGASKIVSTPIGANKREVTPQ